MTQFDDVILPDRIGYGSQLGPFWSRDVVTTAAGFLAVSSPWSEPLQTFSIEIAPDQVDQIWEFLKIYEAIGGTLGSFLMRDWSNWNSTQGLMRKGDEASITHLDQPLRNTVTGLFTGDGVTETFQVVQEFKIGTAARYRTIKKLSGLGPIGDQLKIGEAGSLRTAGVTKDNSTGIVTITPAPANGLAMTAGYAFYRAVTFAGDSFLQGLVGGEINDAVTVNLREVRLP